MSNRNIDKEFQINTRFLDRINFIPFLTQYERLGEMMEAIEEITYNAQVSLPSELQGNVFNYYSEEDFKEYLSKRYPNIDFYLIEDYLINYKGE